MPGRSFRPALALAVAAAAALFTMSQPVLGQSKREGKLAREGKLKLEEGDFRNAVGYFERLIVMNPDKTDYQLYLALCHMNIKGNEHLAIPYLERFVDGGGGDTYPEAYSFLGKAYHTQYKFAEAIAAFEKYRSYIRQNRKGQKLADETKRFIEMCENGIRLLKEPVQVRIENLGRKLNSPYDDYAPVISIDETFMYFTSRRRGSTGGLLADDGMYFEDIYLAGNTGGEWAGAVSLDSAGNERDELSYEADAKYVKADRVKGINTEGHDAAIGLSIDGQKMFIYRESDIWMSTHGGKRWSDPVRLNQKFNSKKGQETSISLSADGKTLYIVSSRKGGIGGKDIYKAELQADGTWSDMVNLGPAVNTPYDEDAPFIHPDGQTLYFSSKGHSSMGGYDVFRTVYGKGRWSEPENLGYPINTPGEDIYFVLNARGTQGYYSTSRPDGFGGMDIYAVNFGRQNVPFTEIRGLVLAGHPLAPAAATVTVTNLASGKKVGTYTANRESGKYILVLPPGMFYNVHVECEGYEAHSEDIFLPNQYEYYQLYQEIHFMPVEDPRRPGLSQKSVAYNALFDLKSEIQRNDPALYASLNGSDDIYSSYVKTLISIDQYILSHETSDIPSQKEVIDELRQMQAADIPYFQEIKMYFDYDMYLLRKESVGELKRMCAYLLDNPHIHAEFYGHTDSKGPEDYNQRLSLRRAEAAVDYLIAKGVAPSRLKAFGVGEAEPVASNDSYEGRQQNRRLELKLIFNARLKEAAAR